MKVKFLSEEQIENSSFALLAGYGREFGEIRRPPIPVEEILESHLKLRFDFDDLPRLMGKPGVLGAIWIPKREVKIDQSLDPTVDPSKEGRYRFTVSHEVGHWELHRHLFSGHPGQGSLFREQSEPIVCRAGATDPIEWQANSFAAYLLMPKEMVLKAWKTIHGKLDPYVAIDELADLNVRKARWGLGPDDCPAVRVARDMARKFKVSGQAMQIRLIRLGLILTKTPAPSLFAR